MKYRVTADGKEMIVEKELCDNTREADNIARREIIDHYLDEEGVSEVIIEGEYERGRKSGQVQRYAGAAGYWEDIYRQQREEIPRNEYEKKFLELLGEGKGIIESVSVLKEMYDVSEEKGLEIFRDLKKRCDEWEIKNLLRKEEHHE